MMEFLPYLVKYCYKTMINKDHTAKSQVSGIVDITIMSREGAKDEKTARLTGSCKVEVFIVIRYCMLISLLCISVTVPLLQVIFSLCISVTCIEFPKTAA